MVSFAGFFLNHQQLGCFECAKGWGALILAVFQATSLTSLTDRSSQNWKFPDTQKCNFETYLLINLNPLKIELFVVNRLNSPRKTHVRRDDSQDLPCKHIQFPSFRTNPPWLLWPPKNWSRPRSEDSQLLSMTVSRYEVYPAPLEKAKVWRENNSAFYKGQWFVLGWICFFLKHLRGSTKKTQVNQLWEHLIFQNQKNPLMRGIQTYFCWCLVWNSNQR